MASSYAIVDDTNVVINVVFWDGKAEWEPPSGTVLPIPLDLIVGIGDTFDGVTVIPLNPPSQPDDPQEELLQLQQLQQLKQLEVAQAQAAIAAIAVEITAISVQIGIPVPDPLPELPIDTPIADALAQLDG